ncbi:hypothetical protein HZH66_013366 [Vespula vulgaris]|uniref:Transferrin-like domain-containing protein n=1 Tax=Vespula vulgaris TaxID=7454 RepID=A0A834J9L3_VESVU|nr:hypothetical protein HZH66_013366 [Vespula vulgaris]
MKCHKSIMILASLVAVIIATDITAEDGYYHYEAVAVIQKDLNVSDAKGLRHLKSCHTGIRDDIGYNIPLAKLAAIGDNINNTEYFVRDNEFQALSLLFSKACLVETWSSDPTINRKLNILNII